MSREHRAEGTEQRAKSREQRAESKEQRAKSKKKAERDGPGMLSEAFSILERCGEVT
jgi:hypothetical protein